MRINNKDGFKMNISNGLLLYYHPYSFNSQKVLMVLHEKHLPFEECVINLMENQQCDPTFLGLNPRGEIPVLQHLDNVITESTKIIDYLEDHFRDDPYEKLIPIEEGPRIRQKVTYFRFLIEQIQSGILTLGSCYHDEHLKYPKMPFIKPVRTAMKNAESKRPEFFKLQSEYFPQLRHIYQRKLLKCQRRHEIIADPKEFSHQLELVDSILDKIEEELASHLNYSDGDHYWLCTKSFTVSDISLTILLERLNKLGLAHRFWENQKRPEVEKYFLKVRQRESYKKSVPILFTHLQLLYQGHRNMFIISASTLASLVFIGGFLFCRKS